MEPRRTDFRPKSTAKIAAPPPAKKNLKTLNMSGRAASQRIVGGDGAASGSVAPSGRTAPSGRSALNSEKSLGSTYGGAKRQEAGLDMVVNTKKYAKKMVLESKKKRAASFKLAAEAGKDEGGEAEEAEEEDHGGSHPVASGDEGVWLVPPKARQRQAHAMRGKRTKSVDKLRNDETTGFSKTREYRKLSRSRGFELFGRRLMEDRDEILSVLHMKRNVYIVEAGVKEYHLTVLEDMYNEIMYNAHKRREEDARGGKKKKSDKDEDTGIRISPFVTTLGLSPLLFTREVFWASSRLYAHAVAGEMNRATWMFGCISLCLMSEEELLTFLFNTRKQSDIGELELGELESLVEGLHLSNTAFYGTFEEELKQIVELQATAKIVVDLPYFKQLHVKHPMIFFPAFRLQELLQERTLKKVIWTKMRARLDRYIAKEAAIANGTWKEPLILGCIPRPGG